MLMKNHCCILLVISTLFLGIRPEIASSQIEDDLENEIPRLATGSCKKSGLCCPGRDSSCVVQKAKPNAIIEDLDDIPCFCDYACLTIGDCCADFHAACGVFDCHVSSWGPWSECDADCGSGAMTRTRSITQEPRNGGKPCPSLVQKRGCFGTRCQQNIRTSLEGNHVCALCEREAQRAYADYRCVGSGAANGFSTRFSSLREPSCHGKWKHIRSNATCSCANGADDFIFV